MDTNNFAKVVIKMPFEGSKVVELPEVTSYESFCKLKEMVHMEYAQAINFDFDETVIAFCDEEGKLKNLPFNFNLTDRYNSILDVICGGVFFLSVDPMDESEVCGLNEEQIKNVKRYLYDNSFVKIEIVGEWYYLKIAFKVIGYVLCFIVAIFICKASKDIWYE